MALNLDDDEVTFVSCETLVDPAIVSIEVRDFRTWGSEWVDILDATVSSDIEAGEQMGTTEMPPGAEVELGAARPRPGETVAVFVQLPRGPSSLDVEFVVPEDGLPDGSWLRPTGEIWSEPCAP